MIYNRPKIVTSLEIVREDSSDKASNVPEGTVVESSKYTQQLAHNKLQAAVIADVDASKHYETILSDLQQELLVFSNNFSLETVTLWRLMLTIFVFVSFMQHECCTSSMLQFCKL